MSFLFKWVATFCLSWPLSISSYISLSFWPIIPYFLSIVSLSPSFLLGKNNFLFMLLLNDLTSYVMFSNLQVTACLSFPVFLGHGTHLGDCHNLYWKGLICVLALIFHAVL